MADQDLDSVPATAQAGLALDGDAMADDAAAKAAKKQADIARRRERLLLDINLGTLDTEMAKVAAILNAYPDARDSDITLLLRYWEEHEGIGPDDTITPRDLYALPRLPTLVRARAAVQNELGLFKATAEVQQRRGTLSEEEREKARRRQPSAAPVISVYADETGKQRTRLIVASVWVLVPSLRMPWPDLGRTRDQEFHFTEMTRQEVDTYKAFTEFMLSSTPLGFKCLSVPRPVGNPDTLLEEMYARLLVDGVRHEIASNRVALPRTVQFRKDQDEAARDALACARLRDRVDVMAAQEFDAQLSTDVFEPVDSKYAVYVQLADLFAGSLK